MLARLEAHPGAETAWSAGKRLAFWKMCQLVAYAYHAKYPEAGELRVLTSIGGSAGEVPFAEDEGAKLKEIALPKEKRPRLVEAFEAHYGDCGDVAEAVRRTEAETGYRQSWIYLITEDLRREIAC